MKRTVLIILCVVCVALGILTLTLSYGDDALIYPLVGFSAITVGAIGLYRGFKGKV